MAYGKDKEGRDLVQASAFRSRTFNQAARALSRNKFPSTGGGKGGPPYWVDQFLPPIGYDATIRLLPGNFKQSELIEISKDEVQVVEVDAPFVKFVEHFDGTNQRGCICSAGPLAHFKDKRDPCLGCDIYWATAARNSAGRFESSRMSKQNKYAFALFDYRPFHEIEQIDRSTGLARKNTAGIPYKEWKACMGRGCDYCKGQVPIAKVGHSTHWAINYTQLQIFRAAERDIGRSCTVCGNVQCINSLAWICSNCQECIIDMDTTELKPQELIEKTDDEQTCPFCQYKGNLDEIYECRPCAERGLQGLRATLFDVDLTLTMVQVNDKKQLTIKTYSAPHPIAPEFVEAAKPLDLVRRYRPDTIHKQSEQFGVAMTQPAGAPAGGAPTQVPYQNPNKLPS